MEGVAERVLVPSRQLKPELVVGLHQAGQMERSEVQAVVASLVDQYLACARQEQERSRSASGL